ncbi:MAG: cytochrome c oxidase subunit II [Planctomycetes bacterium]|nr:cytochrome c oxidase subunit II [Planctomycetota bacterium]
MPPQASTVAGATDYVFYYILYISAAFFILINGAMFYFIWKYRRRGPHDKVGRITHSTPLEIGWSVIPGLLLIPMFWWGFKGYMEQRTFPPNCLEINVVAAKWNWTFIYSNSFTSNELHVPVDTPVRLIMRSNDVIHSCFIPAFRVKRDVVPGRYADLWFRATRTGRFPLVCAEYCGTSHSDMKADVYVHPKVADGQAKDPLDKSYDEWLKNADPYGKLTPEQYAEYTKDYEAFKTKYGGDEVMKPIVEKLAAPPERGQQLWDKKGCKSCHTLDGTPSQGPSWKGVFGKEEALADGTKAKVDENYLRESILEPNAKIVAGFARGVMPKTPLKDYEIDALIAFFKSLSGDQK